MTPTEQSRISMDKENDAEWDRQKREEVKEAIECAVEDNDISLLEYLDW